MKQDIPLQNVFSKLVKWFLAVFAILAVSGCIKVGPDYVKPEIPLSTAWHSTLKDGFSAEVPELQTMSAWWTLFGDRNLSNLIDRAVTGNLDLKKAKARVREARAKRGMAKSDLFPTLDTTAKATRSRSSDNAGNGKISRLYATGFDSQWELDVFGGVSRSLEAATADLQASREDLRDVLVSLLAEVTLNYVEVRTYQARIAVAEKNLEAQKESYDLTFWRNQAGLDDELAVQQARYNLEETRSGIPALKAELEAAMNRIAVLLGEQPGKIHEELNKNEPIPVAPRSIAVGVPADVIRQRPDIRKAERELAAQTARIGVAKADLYPKFKLSGSIGLESLSKSSLFSTDSRTYSFGPGISWRIFDAGAIRQNIEVQSALQEQYQIAYESVILSAVEEVENALIALAEEQDRRKSLSEATAAADKAVELAQKKYQSGLTSFNDVLDAQRSLLSFQDSLRQSEGKITSNLVRLYKVLGGGWTVLAPEERN